jgi:hypothetical protein
MKTYTPNLDPAVLDRLRDYAALFAEDFLQLVYRSFPALSDRAAVPAFKLLRARCGPTGSARNAVPPICRGHIVRRIEPPGDR